MAARLVLALILLLLAAPAAVGQTGGADAPTEGGTGAPDSRFSGGDDGAARAPGPAPPAQPAPTVAPPAPTAPEVVSPAPQAKPAQRKKDPDVDVEVPVPDPLPDRAPDSDDSGSTVLGGLASTGFAVAVLAVLGMTLGGAGLMLRRASRQSTARG